MRYRLSRESGLTVVELLLVVVILAILYYVFVPHYTKEAITKHKVYSTAHDLAADLRYARRLAMGGGLEGNPVTIPSAAEYDAAFLLEVYKSAVASATDSWKIYSGWGEEVKNSTALKDMKITEGSATSSIYFDEKGAPKKDGTALATEGVYFEVEDTNSLYKWRVSVARGTGQVSLREM